MKSDGLEQDIQLNWIHQILQTNNIPYTHKNWVSLLQQNRREKSDDNIEIRKIYFHHHISTRTKRI